MPYLPCHADNVVSERAGSDIVVIRPGSGETFELNGMSAEVWDLCTGQVSRNVAAEALGLSDEELDAHVARLADAGLLAADGYTRRVLLQRGALVGGSALALSPLMGILLPRAAAAASVVSGGGTGSGTDISGTGTPVAVGGNNDDFTVAVTSGFPVTFYGVTTSTLNIGSNGNIQLDSSRTDYSNTGLPASGFGATAFVYWDDLIVYAGDGIYTQTSGSPGSRVFTVQWKVHHFNDSSTPQYDFLAQFFEASPGKVVYTYNNVVIGNGNSNGNSATVGSQNSDGSSFQEIEANSGGISNGQTITLNHP